MNRQQRLNSHTMKKDMMVLVLCKKEQGKNRQNVFSSRSYGFMWILFYEILNTLILPIWRNKIQTSVNSNHITPIINVTFTSIDIKYDRYLVFYNLLKIVYFVCLRRPLRTWDSHPHVAAPSRVAAFLWIRHSRDPTVPFNYANFPASGKP